VLSIQGKLARTPFDIPDAKTEIVAGYYTEFSGPRLAIIELAKGLLLFDLCAIGICLFFTFSTKLVFFYYCLLFIFLITLIRAITARLKIDQTLKFYWTFVLLLALIDFVRVVK
jgi:NADH-quinone oxidoreductase subunit H